MPQRYRKITVDGKTKQLSRHLMEQKLGRKLHRLEYVHHANHDKLDDRIENYELTTPKAHSIHHNQKHPITTACRVCGRTFEPHPTKRARKVTCSRDCFRKRGSEAAREQMARGCTFAQFTRAEAHGIAAWAAFGGVSYRRIALLLGCHHNTIGAIARGAYVAKDGALAEGALGVFSLSTDAVWVRPDAEARHA